jgi:hypothetical protein
LHGRACSLCPFVPLIVRASADLAAESLEEWAPPADLLAAAGER